MVVPELGAWFPTDQSRPFIRAVDRELTVLRRIPDTIDATEFRQVRQVLLDEWTSWERIKNWVIDQWTGINELYSRQHLIAKVSVWPTLGWIVIGIVASGFWVFAPWRLTHWSLPKVGASEPPPIKWWLQVLAWYGWLGRTRRPVKQWFKRYRTEFESSCFLERDPVKERTRYSPPLDNPIDAVWFTASSRRLLWIHGSGGSGKSALAFHLAHKALVAQSAQPIPVLVDENWEGTLAGHVKKLMSPSELTANSVGQLKLNRSPTEIMVIKLGSLGFLCPIVDSLSERTLGEAALNVQEAIGDGHFRHMLITSRERRPEGQVWEKVHSVETKSVTKHDIRAFVASYVDDASRRNIFTARMHQLLQDADDTGSPSALFLRFALEQMIEDETVSLHRIDLVLRYVQAARKGKVDVEAADFERAASLAAIEALRNERLLPAEIDYQYLRGVLGTASDTLPFMNEKGDAHLSPPTIIEYLVSCGVIQRNRLNHQLQFTYDPVAEYLAAKHLVQMPDDYASTIRNQTAKRSDSGLSKALQQFHREAAREPELGSV